MQQAAGTVHTVFSECRTGDEPPRLPCGWSAEPCPSHSIHVPHEPGPLQRKSVGLSVSRGPVFQWVNPYQVSGTICPRELSILLFPFLASVRVCWLRSEANQTLCSHLIGAVVWARHSPVFRWGVAR